ncbi:MAG: L,D-transpeptidase [Candidatus Portnoybacteria bacterium]|nr:L,D-transpeptidase [Candidatus Portnoybacteria bacterium]
MPKAENFKNYNLKIGLAIFSIAFFVLVAGLFFWLPILNQGSHGKNEEVLSGAIKPDSIPLVFLPENSIVQKKIEINLSSQRMMLWEDEKQIVEHIISSGRYDKPTKPGNFSILSKYPVAYGGAEGVSWTMPFFMGIYKVGGTENGIHELPYLNGWRESGWDLGHPVSHGCVRLGIGPAEKVYNWAEIGTPVWIHY